MYNVNTRNGRTAEEGQFPLLATITELIAHNYFGIYLYSQFLLSARVMFLENLVDTELVDTESLSLIPFFPHSTACL